MFYLIIISVHTPPRFRASQIWRKASMGIVEHEIISSALDVSTSSSKISSYLQPLFHLSSTSRCSVCHSLRWSTDHPIVSRMSSAENSLQRHFSSLRSLLFGAMRPRPRWVSSCDLRVSLTLCSISVHHRSPFSPFRCAAFVLPARARMLISFLDGAHYLPDCR